MDCLSENVLQELLDGARDARAARGHLKACASCAVRFRRLESAVRRIERLPDHHLGAAFNRKVLAALGRAARPVLNPNWTPWAAGALLSLSTCWLGALAFAAARCASRPQELILLAKIWAVKAGLTFAELLPLLKGFAERGAPDARLWLQLGAGAFMAGGVLLLLSRDALQARQWRTR